MQKLRLTQIFYMTTVFLLNGLSLFSKSATVSQSVAVSLSVRRAVINSYKEAMNYGSTAPLGLESVSPSVRPAFCPSVRLNLLKLRLKFLPPVSSMKIPM